MLNTTYTLRGNPPEDGDAFDAFDAFDNVAVSAGTGDLVINAGEAGNGFAQVGHSAAGGADGRTFVGDVEVDVDGQVTLNASSAAGGRAQIGHGIEGGTFEAVGDIAATVTEDVVLAGGNGESASAQIDFPGSSARSRVVSKRARKSLA